MAKPRVLCVWDLMGDEKALGRLRSVADVDVVEPDRDWLLQHLHEYDAYLATLYVRLDRELLERAPRLKLVATPSTGLDHLDLDALKQRGIHLISIKTEFGLLDQITATAELTWALLLAAVRKIPWGFAAACEGRWARNEFRGHQLSGMTLGILGVGRLGKMTADYGHAFRMRVLGHDLKPFNVPGAVQVPHVQSVDLDTLLRESDVISIHIHMTDDNRHFINAERIAKMKDGVVLLNSSRGGIIDEDAMLAALRSGKIGAAGLDVIDGEWRTDLVDHPLIRYAREHDNLVIMPHVGGVTWESQRMSHAFVANKTADALEGKR
jgi:D-3-phosphoglycerate dehydrogenase